MGNKELYQNVFRPAILALQSGTEFRLRDLRLNPPALIGKMVYDDRLILGIEKMPNPLGDCNLWKKL